jgi:hypothetical protein
VLGSRIEMPTTPKPIGLHNRGRTHQTQASVPFNLTEPGD